MIRYSTKLILNYLSIKTGKYVFFHIFIIIWTILRGNKFRSGMNCLIELILIIRLTSSDHRLPLIEQILNRISLLIFCFFLLVLTLEAIDCVISSILMIKTNIIWFKLKLFYKQMKSNAFCVMNELYFKTTNSNEINTNSFEISCRFW